MFGIGSFVQYIKDIRSSTTLKQKLLFTLGMLFLYRMLVFLPVPFADVESIMGQTLTTQGGGGLEYFAMLLGGTLQQFSIVAVGLIPYINASIIMQLLTAVLPQLEELKEQGEVGNMKIQQYTRWLALPLAFLQSIGMVYFINSIFNGAAIDTSSMWILLGAAFTLTVGTVMLIWIGELITEKGVSNGISMIIFSSIVAGMTSKIYTFIASAGTDIMAILIFMILIVLVLVVLSVLLVLTRKEIPIVYARQGKVEETAVLPIPLNPVGMIPIIFAIAFTTFPYLLSQMIAKFGTQSQFLTDAANWIQSNFNIYTQNPSLIVIAVYFVLIVMFTFFYTLITFNPDRMADNIQKRGGFIPGIRPGEETAIYINSLLMHLCFWGGIGLGIIGIYSYMLSYIPFVQQAATSFGSIPIVVSGSGIIIIVGVVREIINKINSELLMDKYDKI